MEARKVRALVRHASGLVRGELGGGIATHGRFGRLSPAQAVAVRTLALVQATLRLEATLRAAHWSGLSPVVRRLAQRMAEAVRSWSAPPSSERDRGLRCEPIGCICVPASHVELLMLLPPGSGFIVKGGP